MFCHDLMVDLKSLLLLPVKMPTGKIDSYRQLHTLHVCFRPFLASDISQKEGTYMLRSVIFF